MQSVSARHMPYAWTHPYARVYCAVVLTFAAALASSPLRMALIGALAGAAALAAGVSWRKWIYGIVPILSLALGILVLSLLSGMSLGDVQVRTAVIFLIRCYLCFITIAALFAVTDQTDIIQAFEALRVPVLLTTVAGSILRWFYVLAMEARRMNAARSLRGGDTRGRVVQLRGIARMSASLMTRSFLRAERVASAMECRGFHGRLVRSIPRAIRPADLLIVVGVCCYVAAAWVVTG